MLAEYLEHSAAAVGSELAVILEDCSDYEKRVIVESAISLKHVLRDVKYMFGYNG